MMFLNSRFIKISIFLRVLTFCPTEVLRHICKGLLIYRNIHPEVFIDNVCKQDQSNSYFKIDGWPYASLTAALTSPKMFNSIFKAFSDMLRVSKIVSLESWLHFGFRIKTKRGLRSSTCSTREFYIWAALFSSLKIMI